MKLKKELNIKSFKFTYNLLTPFILEVYTSTVDPFDYSSEFILTKKQLKKYGLSSPLKDLTKESLLVTLEPRMLDLNEEVYISSPEGMGKRNSEIRNQMKEDEIYIGRIEKIKYSNWGYGTGKIYENVVYRGVFERGTPYKAPYVKLELPLNKKEFGELKKLNALTVMKMNLELKEIPGRDEFIERIMKEI